jgi:hypothetical protein
MLPPALTRINAAPRADHALIERKRAAIGDVTQALANVPKARDAAYEQAFSLLYGDPGRASARNG